MALLTSLFLRGKIALVFSWRGISNLSVVVKACDDGTREIAIEPERVTLARSARLGERVV